MIMAGTFEIHGHCDDRFSSVKEAFANNFEQGLEVGASFAATIDGKFVVDIWGGYADEAQTRPWEKDTIVCVWSTTKVMTSICALMLIDRGLLDPDAPVAKYWPEFAQAGKETVLVRHILSHTAGLPALDSMPLPNEELSDWDRVVELLAAQKPWWEPGKDWGYHAITFGHLVGEVVRRITGKTLGTFFREEVAEPLGADFHIGLPEEHEPRVAEIIPPPELNPGDLGYISPESVIGRAMNFPVTSALIARERFYRALEFPASNGHGNACSVARIASVIACGGECDGDGVRLMEESTIDKALEEQYYNIPDPWPIPIRFGIGFALNSKEIPMSPNPRVLWWGGWGGSIVVMDLDARLSYSYAMNKMSNMPIGDPRVVPLGIALYKSLR
jgi:CubicO group peptidase (beta-lactamase class C family)